LVFKNKANLKYQGIVTQNITSWTISCTTYSRSNTWKPSSTNSFTIGTILFINAQPYANV